MRGVLAVSAEERAADHAPPPTRRARQAARVRLEDEIARPRAPSRRLRWWDSQQAAWLLLALAFVGGLIVVVRDMAAGGDLSPSDLVRSEPAKDVLELAASGREGLALPLTPGRDQYLYTREITEAEPVDPGGTPRTFVEDEWLAMDEQARSRTCELGRCWTSSSYGIRSTEQFERIPREPRRLLLYARAFTDPSAGSRPFTDIDWMLSYEFLFGLLRTPLIVPPDLRSAAVRALAYTPHARVLDERLEFRGRPAAAIYFPSWDPGSSMDRYLADIIIDRYTHEYLGERWELGPADMKGRRNQRLFNSSRVRLVSHIAEAAVVDRMGERP